jgi:hypothetical protein
VVPRLDTLFQWQDDIFSAEEFNAAENESLSLSPVADHVTTSADRHIICVAQA